MPIPKNRSEKERNYIKKNYIFYGEPKSGKTTIAAGFGDDHDNRIMFFTTEPGHKFQEIYKWKNEKGEDPTTWTEFKACARELITQTHPYKCLVIDTVDILWEWCTKEVCKDLDIDHESDLGYGKGYQAIKKEFMEVINFLTQKGYGIIFISHAKTGERTFGNTKMTYTDLTLGNTGRKAIAGLVDYIFYFYIDNNNKRLIRTKSDLTVNAGDRGGTLPETIEMNAEILIDELKKETT